ERLVQERKGTRHAELAVLAARVLADDEDAQPGRLHPTVVDSARAWFEENWDPDLTIGEWWERLVASGWGFPQFPTEWFGRGLETDDARRVDEECRRAGAAPPPNRMGAVTIAPLLIEYATPLQ